MSHSQVIVIGASSGGVSAVLELASRLPRDLPAAIGIVLHVGAQHSILPELLSARGVLPAMHPRDGQPLKAGAIYVAPPDHHMLFTKDVVRLSRGPRENYARPAIDPLFRSAAVHWGERAIGVVLTGELDDGTAGLQAIKECGGKAVVQDPADAAQPSMPANALASVVADFCLPLADIPAVLLQLAATHAAIPPDSVPDRLLREQAIFEGRQYMENLSAIAEPSSLTCPDCGGSLWELNDTRPLRYRCHTGHAFTARTLDSTQAQTAEHALWSTMRALQEREILLRRLAVVAHATGDAAQAEAGRLQADRVRATADQLKQVIEQEGPLLTRASDA